MAVLDCIIGMLPAFCCREQFAGLPLHAVLIALPPAYCRPLALHAWDYRGSSLLVIRVVSRMFLGTCLACCRDWGPFWDASEAALRTAGLDTRAAIGGLKLSQKKAQLLRRLLLCAGFEICDKEERKLTAEEIDAELKPGSRSMPIDWSLRTDLIPDDLLLECPISWQALYCDCLVKGLCYFATDAADEGMSQHFRHLAETAFTHPAQCPADCPYCIAEDLHE